MWSHSTLQAHFYACIAALDTFPNRDYELLLSSQPSKHTAMYVPTYMQNSLSNYTDAGLYWWIVHSCDKKVNMFTLSGFSAALLLHQPISIITTRGTSILPILVNWRGKSWIFITIVSITIYTNNSVLLYSK